MKESKIEVNSLIKSSYSAGKIWKIWLAATIPMALLAWVLAPFLIRKLPFPSPIVFWPLLILGTLWQIVLSLLIVRGEEGDLSWTGIKRRLLLNAPINRRAGKPSPWMFLWAIPLSILNLLLALSGIAAGVILGAIFMYCGMAEFVFYPIDLVTPELANHQILVTSVAALWVFSSCIGEELLFRGILLPGMNRACRRADWLANAGLYALYHIYQPWLIPSRFIGALITSLTVKRFRSCGFALLIRLFPNLLFLAILVFITFNHIPLKKLPDVLDLPQFSNQRTALNIAAQHKDRLTSIPSYNPLIGGPFQIDFRSRDVSHLDLKKSPHEFLHGTFDNLTIWPEKIHMPPDFYPDNVLELGKNPGLGVRALHEQGITGKGWGIGIIDTQMQVTHIEYTHQLRWYEEIGIIAKDASAHLHGPAVSSLAVGKNIGTAPDADLYFIATGAEDMVRIALYPHYFATGIRRLLEINRRLPPDRKIRAISISMNMLPLPGTGEFLRALQEASNDGVLVLYGAEDLFLPVQYAVFGLARPIYSDPDRWESFEFPPYIQRGYFSTLRDNGDSRLFVPMGERTTASPTGDSDYVFYGDSGVSWALPYVAGLCALAAQVNPSITPERFWELAVSTGHPIPGEMNGYKKIIGHIPDPKSLIEAVQRGRSTNVTINSTSSCSPAERGNREN